MDNGFLQVDFNLKAKYVYSYDLRNKFTLNKYQQVIYGLEKLRLKNKGFYIGFSYFYQRLKLTENFTAELRCKNALEHAEKKTKETKRALMTMKEQRDANEGANADTWN